ncbi:MAG: RNA-binding protein [DPANN group archaeon]|nr:RNA-binding protein [DPANN group archaeon]
MVEKIHIKDKDVIVPGTLLAEGLEYLPSGKAFRDGENIYSSTVGLISVKGRVIKVIPLAGKYAPKRGDVIIAKINGFGKFGWTCEIESPYKIDLNVGEISMNYVDLKNSKLADYFKISDYVFGEILDISESGYISLTAKRMPYRKLVGGNVIKVSPVKIPRIIGKQGSMIKILKDSSNCEILVGQNGLVWIKGNAENEAKVANAIKLIEQESHHSGLTEKVKAMLEGK